ncbi:MAG: YdeI/OmpD-associated family protein [Rubricella sp.]
MAAGDDALRVEVRSRADLRAWLAENHATASSVWLVTYKKHHPDYLAYEPLVEEILCWGWIDSVRRRVDEDRARLLISPRKESSAWSAINKAHVDRAIASGAMTQAGLAKIEAAKANGMWSFLDDVERLEVPADLARAFANHPRAAAEWEAFPRSVKRGILEWIKQAKTPQTRANRIKKTAEQASRGERANQFVRQDTNRSTSPRKKQ